MDGELVDSTDAILDCDFCGKPMDGATYASHACDGLRGLNPLDEKLKKVSWNHPDGPVRGTVRAKGSIRPARGFLNWLKRLG